MNENQQMSQIQHIFSLRLRVSALNYFRRRKMKNRQAASMGSFLAIGIGVGTALGAAFDNIGLGLALGVAIGTAIGGGVAASQRAEADKADDNNKVEGDE